MTNGLAFCTMPVKIMNGLGEAVIMEIYQKITPFHGLIGGQKNFEVLEEIILDLTFLESFKFYIKFRIFLYSSCMLFSLDESNKYPHS